MRTALFLGAGASAFVDLPTTVELMDRLRTRVSNEEHGRGMSQITKLIIDKGDYSDVEKLYDGIDRVLHLSDDAPNIKPIFNVLQGSDSTFKQTLDELRNTQSIISDVLFESFVTKSTVDDQIVRMYDMVRSVVSDGDVDEFLVFTTNYDNVLERYCYKKNLSVVNGFVDGGRGIFIWADRWPTDVTNYMRLLKLHGSIFWHEDVDGQIVEAGVPAPRGGKKDIVIAPTEGVKDYGDEPFHSLFERFKKEIDGVDVLLVIGFSYRDEEIVGIIKNGLKKGMVLISVSPEAATDITRMSNAEIKTTDFNGQTIKTAGEGIVLVEQRFEPNNIDAVRASLEAACGFVRNSAPGPHASP